jgi:RNA polymerase sigma-70 factor (ECF subfamily)
MPDFPSDGPLPETAAAQTETAEAVRQALAALPEHLRVPVVLRYYAGLSEREIATAIRRRPGTVKSRLHEARRRLSDDAHLAAFVTATEMDQ